MSKPDPRASLSIACAIALLVSSPGCAPRPPVANEDDVNRVVPVRTVAVAQTELRQTTLQPATVHAYYRSELHPRVSGYISEIRVDIGDFVEKGEALVGIDIPEMESQRQVIQARITRLKAEEKRAEAGVNLARARVRSSEAGLTQAESEMGSVEASLAAAVSEFSRTEDLVERGSLQERMLDEARKKRDSERAAKEAVASMILSAKAEVSVAKAQLVAAEADQEAAKAETEIEFRKLEELEVMIDYGIITAPISGVVTERNAEPGNLVGDASSRTGSQPLFVISQVARVRVHVPVPEADAATVNQGDKVVLTFPSFPGETPIEAAVTRTSGSLDPSTRTMLVEVELENEDGKLIPGMFGQASIEFSTKVAANVLPSRAIRFGEEGNAYVYVVGDDDTVAVTPIETGLDNGKSIEVANGLQAGQRVIDAHLKRFRDGQKVAVLSD